MDEIDWSRRLDPFNHCCHFPHFVTHMVGAMPVACVGGALSDVLSKPKCGKDCWKVTVAVDFLGNIVWICPLSPGTTPDVLIWDKEGPQRARGDFLTMKQGSTTGLTRAVSIPSSLLWVGKSSQTDKGSTIPSTVGTGQGGSIFLPTCGTGRWCETSGQVQKLTCMTLCACCSTPPSFCASVRCCTNPMEEEEESILSCLVHMIEGGIGLREL